MNTANRYSDMVIIGAGFSGINLACQLQRKLNFTDYVIYDRATDFGGTWSANKCKRHSCVLQEVANSPQIQGAV